MGIIKFFKLLSEARKRVKANKILAKEQGITLEEFYGLDKKPEPPQQVASYSLEYSLTYEDRINWEASPYSEHVPPTTPPDFEPYKQALSSNGATWVSLFVLGAWRDNIKSFLIRQGQLVRSNEKTDIYAHICTGYAYRQPYNRYDHRAICVAVEGNQIGYFALEWKDVMHECMQRHQMEPIAVKLLIIGRFTGRRKKIRAVAFADPEECLNTYNEIIKTKVVPYYKAFDSIEQEEKRAEQAYARELKKLTDPEE